MSGSKRYKDEFDKYAGAPAEFDSLFVFEKGKLHAKKQIRKVPSGGKAAISLVTAAAIMIAAGAALSAVSKGGISTVGELSAGNDGSTVVTAAAGTAAGDEAQTEEVVYSYESEAALPELKAALYSDEQAQDIFACSVVSAYPYAVDARLTRAAEPAVLSDDSYYDLMSSADFILRGFVRDKGYDEETDEIIYEIRVTELTSKSDVTPLILGQWDIMTVCCTGGAGIEAQNELQIGCEYIIPAVVYVGDRYAAAIADPAGRCISKKGEYWKMDADVYPYFAGLTEQFGEDSVIWEDIDGVMTALISEDNMEKGLKSFFVASGEAYVSESSNFDTDPVSLTLQDIFTSISPESDVQTDDPNIHYWESAGETDKTILVWENESPFELSPDIVGKVTYAGVNLRGEQMIRIRLSGTLDGLSVIFAGDMELACGLNDEVYAQVLGRGEAAPIYIRVIGVNGIPAELIF